MSIDMNYKYKTLLAKKFYYLWRLYKLKKENYILMIHAVDHCNLNCYGCNHFSPLAKKTYLNIKTYSNEIMILLRQKAYLIFKEVHILGGEPLLNPDITKILIKTRKAFPQNFTTIKLITNGMLLKKMPIDFWDAIRKQNIIVSITLYPIKFNYSEILQLCDKHKINYEIFDDRSKPGTFELTKLKSKGGKFGDLKNYYRCHLYNCYQLKEGKIYTCPLSANVDILNKKFNVNFKHHKKDFLSIDKLTIVKFWKYRLTPKSFCRNCSIPNGRVDWQYSECSKKEWIE